MKTEQTYQIKEDELLALVDKNRALDATYKLIEIILKTNDFDEMVQKIVDTIPMALGYKLAMLFLIDPDQKKLSNIAVSNTIDDVNIKEKIVESLSNTHLSMGYSENLCVLSLKQQKQIIGKSLYDFLKPNVKKQDADNLQKLLGTNIHIANVLTAQEKPIGVFLVSIAKTEDQLSEFEKEMLRKFSESAGIAVESSRLYKNLKQAKDELTKAYENLKVLNKMKDEFLTVASHELRTPMTIVKSYLWMLEQKKAGKLSKKQEDYLKKAIKGTERMIYLINDMLDISKFEQSKVHFSIEQVNICDLINEVITSFEIKVRDKNLKLSFDNRCKDVFVDIDKEKVKAVISNLIDNAVKFTEKGGVSVNTNVSDTEIKIIVKDTGPGINKEDIEKLFHKFGRIEDSYTIAPDNGGTGLGLYIVKLYIEGMGGAVGAESEGKGKGSTFWFTLPKSKIFKPGSKQVDIPVQQITSIN